MILNNKEDTINCGYKIAKELRPLSFLLLKGPLGAGKTSLVQGIAKGLKINEPVTSRTFAISQHYFSSENSLIHIDLYRIQNKNSALEILYQEEEEANKYNSIIAIEWPEIIEETLNNSWIIDISYNNPSGRIIKIQRPTL